MRYILAILLILGWVITAFASDVLVSSLNGLPNFNSVSEYSSYLYKNFTYQKEEKGTDYWKKSEETIRDKGGDCEDLAILSQEVLKKIGVQSQLIFLEMIDENKKKSGHVFCVYFKNNKAVIFDTIYTLESNSSTVEEVLNDIYSGWIRWSETDITKPRWVWHWKKGKVLCPFTITFVKSVRELLK